MADNTTLNVGVGGDVVATDDIAGVKHQRVKIEIGADGAAADVHSGNPLPVTGTVAATGPLTNTELRATAVPVSGTVTDSIAATTFIAKTYDWTGAVTGGTVWQPAGGKKFVICDIVISASGACTVTLFDGTDNTTLRVMKLNTVAGGGISFNYRKPYVSATADNILKITTSATGGFLTVSGYEI